MTAGDRREHVVFDCPVFAQALINPRGPAADCLRLAQSGRVVLYVNSYVLQEVRELSAKLKPKLGVTPARVEALIGSLAGYAVPVREVPAVYVHPIDPDDSPYVNLALATGSSLLITRDAHLLNLMDITRPEGRALARLFPRLAVITPVALLSRVPLRD